MTKTKDTVEKKWTDIILSKESESIIIDYAYDFRDIAMAQEDLQKMIIDVVKCCVHSELKKEKELNDLFDPN
jgi:hypothetical protein